MLNITQLGLYYTLNFCFFIIILYLDAVLQLLYNIRIMKEERRQPMYMICLNGLEKLIN